MPGTKPAVEQTDYIPISMKQIVFNPGVVEQTIEVHLGDNDQTAEDLLTAEEEHDSVSFALQLS